MAEQDAFEELLATFRVPKVRPAALCAATWWTRRLQVPLREGLYPISDHQRVLFREVLALDVDDQFEAGSSIVLLEVDYDPCDELRHAAMAAGMVMPSPGARAGEGLRRGVRIPTELFPTKRRTWVQEGFVEIKDGYGAPLQTFHIGEFVDIGPSDR